VRVMDGRVRWTGLGDSISLRSYTLILLIYIAYVIHGVRLDYNRKKTKYPVD